MIEEREGAVTWGDVPLTVYGTPLKVGDTAPDFTLVANDYSEVTLADSAGKVRLISVVPSLETGICDAQTRRFDEEAAGLGDNVVVLTVSSEHPLNLKRWCTMAEVEQVQLLSDHMDMNFGNAYGTHIKERRLEQRSIFVVDSEDRVSYLEYLPAIGQHPDYDRALAAAREAAAKV